MTTILTGVVDDQDINQSQRVIDMSPTVALLEPDEAPLCSFLMDSKTNSSPARSSKVEWLETVLLPRLSAAAEAMDTTETGLDVTTGDGVLFKAGDLVRNNSNGEVYFVVSVSTDTLTVKRGVGTATYGTSGTASVGATDELMRITSAEAQGSSLPEVKTVKFTNQYNYTSIIRTPYSFTKTLTASALYEGSEPEWEKKARLSIEHKRQMEHTLFFSGRQLDTSGSEPRGMTGGLTYFVTSNVTTSVGTLTEKLWNAFLRSAGRYGSRRKTVYLSPLVFEAINSFPLGKIHPNSDGTNLTKYGLSLSTYQSPQGDMYDLVVKRDWLDYSSANNGLGGSAFVVDHSNCKLRPLRPTKLEDNLQAPDADKVSGNWITEFSFELKNEKNFAIMKGVTAY